MIHKGEIRDTVDREVRCVLDWSVLNWCVLSILIGQIAGDQTYSQKMPRAARQRVGRAALPCVSRLDAGWGGGPIYAKR